MNTPLSPAAQAVLDATAGTYGNYRFTARRQMIAAALRAVADQVVPEQKPWHRIGLPGSTRHDVRAELLAIAAELEALP